MPKLRVITTGLMYGQTVQNVLHMLSSDPSVTPQVVADYVKTNFIDKVRIFQNVNLRYINILVRGLEEGSPAPFSKIIDAPGQGFDDKRIPSTLSYVLKLQTARAGRHGRGRIILAGVQSDSIQNGFLTASAQESWATTVISPMMGAFLENPSTPVVLCVKDNTNAFTPVTNIQIRGLVGTMRRRQIGVGI